MKNQNQTRTGNPAETPESQARSADGAADKNENPAPIQEARTAPGGKVYVIPVAIGEETAWEIAARTAKRGTGDAWDTLQAALAAAFHSAHAPATQAGRDFAARAAAAFAQIDAASLADDCEQVERDEQYKYAVAAAMLDAFGRQKADISPLDRLLLARAMLESLDSLDLQRPGAAAIRRAAEARA